MAIRIYQKADDLGREIENDKYRHPPPRTKGIDVYIAKHKELGNDGLQLVAVSKARLRRHLAQIGQEPSKYTITECMIIEQPEQKDVK